MAKRIGERAEPCITSTSVLKKGETKLFYMYCICLLTK